MLLSNHISAASLVHVSKVRHAELDEKSHKLIHFNVDERERELKIRVKLFLTDSTEELYPSI